MRIFVAGASGLIGVRLVPLLVEAGHEVAGMTRSPVATSATAPSPNAVLTPPVVPEPARGSPANVTAVRSEVTVR